MRYIPCNVFSDVFSALQAFFTDLGKTKKLGSKKDPIRIHIANILHACSCSLLSSTFDSKYDSLQSFITYLQDSYNFLVLHAESPSNSVNWTVLSLKYNLFSTIPHVAARSFNSNPKRHEALFRLELRKDMFLFISKYVGVGGQSRSQKQSEQKQTEEICSKMKTNEERNTFKSKTADAIQLVERVAAEAMQSLLLGKAFDQNIFDAYGPIFDWISSLFHGQDSPLHEVGRMSIRHLAESNRSPQLVPLLIERSYLSDKSVAHNYFLALVDVVVSFDLDYAIHSVLLLILYKIG
jgi:hypothetical protein